MLSCIFHPSQLLLVSGGDDSQIKIWDLISKTCVATLQAHFSAVTSLAISEDGWTLLSAGRDGVVVLWNLKNYARIATIPVHEAIEAVVALPSKANTGKSDAASHGLLFATGRKRGRQGLEFIDRTMHLGRAPINAGPNRGGKCR